MAKQDIVVNVKFNADASQAKQQAKNLQNSLQNIANTKIVVDDGSIHSAAQAAKTLATELNKATNAQTGKLDFTALTHNLKNANLSLRELSQELLKLGPQGQ